MDIKPDFVFGTQEAPAELQEALTTVAAPVDALAPLRGLIGKWEGRGFNLIWRPFHDTTGGPQDRFLELNRTEECLEFKKIEGDIPNRGLLQPDLVKATGLRGVHYLQQIKDANDPKKVGIHIEPGLWISVPATSNPAERPTVARLASIPHGTTILAQGTAEMNVPGKPQFAAANTVPFGIGDLADKKPFPEADLTKPTKFRTPPALMAGITKQMVDDPNSVLAADIAAETIISSTILKITSHATINPDAGGGNQNIAFLVGKPPGGPNAVSALVEATFWIEKVKGVNGKPDHDLLQYTQTVLLNFNTLSWPHVSVATLRRA